MPQLSRPQRTRPQRRRARARRGLTLAELLVALTLAALLGTLLVSTLTSQQRMYGVMDTRVRVQRNLRTGVSILPADLRAASVSDSDLVALQDTLIQLRATIGSSIVCGIPPSNPSKTQIDLPPLGAAYNVFSTWYTAPAVGDTVWVYDENVDPAPYDDRWSPYKIMAFEAAPTTACAGSVFLDAAKDAPSIKPRYRVTLSNALTDSVRVGAGVRFTRQVRYSLFVPVGSTNAYLGYRELLAGVSATPEILAGPFHRYAGSGRGGLAFAYFDSTGASIPSPVGAADLGRVARVDVTLRSVMQPPRTVDTLRAVRDSAVFRVALRNRQ